MVTTNGAKTMKANTENVELFADSSVGQDMEMLAITLTDILDDIGTSGALKAMPSGAARQIERACWFAHQLLTVIEDARGGLSDDLRHRNTVDGAAPSGGTH